MKKLALMLAALGVFGAANVARAADETYTRSAFYLNLTGQTENKNLDITFMPGMRFDWSHNIVGTSVDSYGRYMDEFYIGPNYHLSLGPVKFTGSAWYYYTGNVNNDIKKDGDVVIPHTGAKYTTQHSILLMPKFDIPLGREFSLTDRVLLQNTFINGAATHSLGYGLLLRNLIQLNYAATRELDINVGWEPFFNLLNNNDADSMVGGSWAVQHHLQAGVDWHFSKDWTISPEYIYEIVRSEAGNGPHTAASGSYFNLTLGYNFKL